MMFYHVSNLLSKTIPKSKLLFLKGTPSSFFGYHSTGIPFTFHPITSSTRNEVMMIYNQKNGTKIASVNMSTLGIDDFRGLLDELKQERAVCTSNAKLKGKVAVVTGSNTGIGKVTAADLAGRGARVILACRNVEKAEDAKMEILERNGFGELECHHLDLASFKSVRKFAEELAARERKLDILVNNAGIMCTPRKITEDGQELTMQSNHFGHFLLTNLLLDLLKASGNARVVSVSSRGHELVKNGISWDDLKWENNPWSEYEAYAQSKLANILFSRELSRRFHGTGISTYCVHPGLVHTEIDRHLNAKLPNLPLKISGQARTLDLDLKGIMLTPEQGAQTTIHCCVDEELGAQTGQYYFNCAQVNPSKQAQDDEAAEKLWAVSEEVVGDITSIVPATNTEKMHPKQGSNLIYQLTYINWTIALNSYLCATAVRCLDFIIIN